MSTARYLTEWRRRRRSARPAPVVPLTNAASMLARTRPGRYRGVRKPRKSPRWESILRHHQRVIHYGLHAIAEAAAHAWDAAALARWGEAALPLLNFPDEHKSS